MIANLHRNVPNYLRVSLSSEVARIYGGRMRFKMAKLTSQQTKPPLILELCMVIVDFLMIQQIQVV